MLNIASKNPETAKDAPEAKPRASGGNGRPGNAQSRTVSVLGGGMTVTGDVVGEGEFRIEGRVEGSVKTSGRVVVDAGGEVEGGVEAQEIVASGKISGHIAATDAVRLKNGCQVEADVQAPVIELEEGGTVNGRLEMKGVAKS
ncbi:MAG: bactofilin family protein [Gemmatimonadota bacterium]